MLRTAAIILRIILANTDDFPAKNEIFIGSSGSPNQFGVPNQSSRQTDRQRVKKHAGQNADEQASRHVARRWTGKQKIERHGVVSK